MKKLLLLTLVLLGGFSTAFADDDTYTVAGDIGLTTVSWSNNDASGLMTKNDVTGKWEWERENVMCAVGTAETKVYSFEVVTTNSWDKTKIHYDAKTNAWGFNDGIGLYNVKITYDESNGNVTFSSTLTRAVGPWVVVGQSDLLTDNWATNSIINLMTPQDDSFILEKENLTLTDNQEYEYKIAYYAANGTWGENYGKDGAKGVSDNIKFTPHYDGSLTSSGKFDIKFTFTPPVSEGNATVNAEVVYPYVQNVELSQGNNIANEIGTKTCRVSDGLVTINRTLHKGYWNTICLPTDMSEADLNTTFGSGKWKLAKFTGCTDSNMDFSSVSSISNNTPYLLWLDESAEEDASFTVNTNWLNRDDAKLTVNPDDAGYKMIGTMAPVTGLTENCLIIKADKVYKSTGSSKVNAMSAYFEVPANAAREFTFSVDNEPTGIKFVVAGDKVENDNCKIYDLQGRQVEKMQRGVYVVNGKKYVK